MSVDKLDLSGAKPAAVGVAQVKAGDKRRALLKSQYYARGEIVEVTYVGQDKISVRTSKAQVPMLPAYFLNNFEEVSDSRQAAEPSGSDGSEDCRKDDPTYQFDVFFNAPSGGSNHCIVQAHYMSEAVDYVESRKGGFVYKAELRE